MGISTVHQSQHRQGGGHAITRPKRFAPTCSTF